MTFKAKTFKLGNSRAVYIPKEVYTELEDAKVYTFKIEWETGPLEGRDMDMDPKKIRKQNKIHLPDKPFNTEFCKKHIGSMKGTCGCK